MLKIEPKLKNKNAELSFRIENNNDENVSYCLILKDHKESCIKKLNNGELSSQEANVAIIIDLSLNLKIHLMPFTAQLI